MEPTQLELYEFKQQYYS